MTLLRLSTALLSALAGLGPLSAQVPQLISYQGRIVADQVNFDGTGQFKFALVNADGSATYWSNDGSSTSGGEPAAAVDLPVSKGLYSVLLGDATQPGMTMLPATVFTHGDVHLRVWFSDGVNGFQQLSPDRRIAAVGYAMMAESVVDGAITTGKIADGAVTSEKLAPGVVQTDNLALGAVGNAQLANSALTITAGTGLGGGGLVPLGGSIALSNAGVLSLTGGNGITVDAASGAVTLGSSAASANTPGAIVARDASGDFSAGTITGSLNGNATTATSAASFTGELAGDVTGTQAATVIAATTITGKALTGLSAAAGSITASDTVLSAIAKLDGNAALKAPLASPTFTGSVTLPAGHATAAPLLLQSGASLTTPIFGAVEFDGTNLFITNNSESPSRKTVAFMDSTITTAQLEDASVTTAKLASGAIGSAQLASGLTLGGTTTGSFNGNFTGNVTGNVSGSAASFTGSLTGDVTGTQSTTVVSTVGGISAANIAAGTTLANNASAASDPSTLVRRDASGNFSAGIISAALNGNAATATTAGSAAGFTGSLVGDVTGTQGATVVASVGTSTASNIHAAELAANAATSANTPGTILKRDTNGDFSAGTITASTFRGKGALPWVVVSGTSQQAEPNTGYIANQSAEVNITLPAAPAVGDIVRVSGVGTGGWKISQNDGQQIDTRIISPPGSSWTSRDQARNWSSVACSSDGSKMLASERNGKLYVSLDSGISWVARESDRNWSSVAMSADGNIMAAVVENGQIYISSNNGTTWTARDSVRSWTGIASTTNGVILYAVAGNNLYRSTNSGTNWELRKAGAFQVKHVACSATGTYVYMAGSTGYLFWSADEGATTLIPNGMGSNQASWSRIACTSGGVAYVAGNGATYRWQNSSVVQIADFDAGNLSCSSDGEKILGGRYYSKDSGMSWIKHDSSAAIPAVSSDFRRLIMVQSDRLIQTSSEETTPGTGGFIRGSISTAIELQHIGNERFLPLSSVGTISTN